MFNFIKNIYFKKQFNHLILTRFNVEVDGFETIENTWDKMFIDTEWLEGRFKLFEAYCLPSVKAQTSKNFSWLVFFHPDTPEEYKLRISNITDKFPQFKPIYIKSNNDIPQKIQDELKRNFSDKNWVITTRIDNDDIIAKDYIDNIQKLFRPENKLILDFYKGYILDHKNLELYKYDYQSNAFISIIENSNNIKSVLSFNHARAKEYGNIEHIDSKRMWSQVIHGENLGNKIYGTKTIKLKDFKKRLYNFES